MSFLLGLTGSIGMGKSTTAKMFADVGIPVWDADATVHAIYAKGGAAVAKVEAAFPAAIRDGAVDRAALKSIIADQPELLEKIEAIVHPLVAANRQGFIAAHDDDILLFDIPLLFETGADAWLDAIVVVSTSADNQRARVLDRSGMTAEQFELILSRQMPDKEKRERADYIIETRTLDSARVAVDKVIADIRGRLNA